MEKKYFLYIDILGFGDLVKENSDEIESLYAIINSLNVHRHETFNTIVFSDTILVYNKCEISSKEDHEYIVMYACEFVQDLMYHLADKNRHFRAILTYDYFKHYNLENVECYYGTALVNCYHKEKAVNGLGLFIDRKILKYHRIFPTIRYDHELDFVCVLQCLQRLYENTEGILPTHDTSIIEQTDEYWAIKFELNILRNIYNNAIEQPDGRVRCKFLQTYQLYKNLFKPLVLALEESNFNVKAINSDADWSDKRETYN